MLGDRNVVSFSPESTADAHTVLATLYFQLCDTGFGDQLDQLTNLFDCHNRIA